jgi:hypothetical protein
MQLVALNDRGVGEEEEEKIRSDRTFSRFWNPDVLLFAMTFLLLFFFNQSQLR